MSIDVDLMRVKAADYEESLANRALVHRFFGYGGSEQDEEYARALRDEGRECIIASAGRLCTTF